MQLAPVDNIWLPGKGVVDLEPYRVHRALQAYDERLVFGRITDEKHPGYGDWCAFVKKPHGMPPHPVLGFGRQIPTPEEAVRRADAANTKRHGTKVLEELKREDVQRRNARDRESLNLAETYADIMMEAEHVKPPQIFVPRGI